MEYYLLLLQRWHHDDCVTVEVSLYNVVWDLLMGVLASSGIVVRCSEDNVTRRRRQDNQV